MLWRHVSSLYVYMPTHFLTPREKVTIGYYCCCFTFKSSLRPRPTAIRPYMYIVCYTGSCLDASISVLGHLGS